MLMKMQVNNLVVVVDIAVKLLEVVVIDEMELVVVQVELFLDLEIRKSLIEDLDLR